MSREQRYMMSRTDAAGADTIRDMAETDQSKRLRELRWAAGYPSAAKFARAHDIHEATYRSHENGNRDYDITQATRYAGLLGTKPEFLMFGVSGKESDASKPKQVDTKSPENTLPIHKPATIEVQPTEYRPADMAHLMPIKSAVRGGDEQEMFLGDPMGWVPRPYKLRNVTGAYAVYIVHDSMVPRYWPGHLAHVNPFSTPHARSGVVVYKTDDSVLIKEFVRRTSKKLILRQYNPAADIEIDLADVRECHVVVGTDEQGR